jgi:small conductance mechanosensitive channel
MPIGYSNLMPFDRAWKTVLEMNNNFFDHLPYLIVGFLVFCFFYILAWVAHRCIEELQNRTQLDVTPARVLSTLAFIGILLIGLLIAATIVFPSFNLFAGLGITSVALGFVFKDILQNLFTGLMILCYKPFKVGDQIKTQDYEGTVEEINIRSTYLITYSHERVVIPNSDLYTKPILVRTAFKKRQLSFNIRIGYSDSIEQARSIIYQVLRECEEVYKKPEPWVYVSELAPTSVNFTIYYWTGATWADSLKSLDQIAPRVKEALEKAGIKIPSPQS